MDARTFQFLRNEKEINELYQLACTQEYVAIDTEFFTQKKNKKFALSLIQICCNHLNYIIDINNKEFF